MNFPLPDTSRVKVTSGTYAAKNLSTLANRHPFTQKLEVLFPEDAKLEAALAQLKTSYAKGVFKLSEIAENGDAFLHSLEAQSKFLLLSIEKNTDDVWCIDSRGILTLFLSKETYQKLGIVGRALPFKHASGERVVQFSLRKNSDTPGNVSRRFTALRAWEKRREQETGFSGWHVVYCCRDLGPMTYPLMAVEEPMNQAEIKEVACLIRKMRDVNVPDVKLHPFPEGKGKDVEERREDWNDDVHALFEWVGMACLGSQRLKLNDRTDPYVALYEPPPSNPGNLTHIQWQGFLSPTFLQLIIDTVISSLNSTEMQDVVPFVSIVCHSVTSTALSYISPKNTSVVPSSAEALRLPREDGEDSWCLYATRLRPDKGDNEVDWLLAESVDKCDTRWG
ncbi:hypothetical protein M378DRAFT_70203 [Amanita muscaria Koide BX008]|uniref:Uncharacterized protein n=1 Tax=Amanita muscaria (strain Koide BX008) TaxID=946122 RepID=A0A0C2X4M9_AMAMK|nr:hypothetical protein M378DRAFT_70203 [Amanita muscaria Koide BX008]